MVNKQGVPEPVGRIGSNAAVASGAEITGIADAVYSTGQAETSLLTAAVNLLQEIAGKEMSINIGDREIARANYRGQKSLGTRLITEFKLKISKMWYNIEKILSRGISL